MCVGGGRRAYVESRDCEIRWVWRSVGGAAPLPQRSLQGAYGRARLEPYPTEPQWWCEFLGVTALDACIRARPCCHQNESHVSTARASTRESRILALMVPHRLHLDHAKLRDKNRRLLAILLFLLPSLSLVLSSPYRSPAHGGVLDRCQPIRRNGAHSYCLTPCGYPRFSGWAFASAVIPGVVAVQLLVYLSIISRRSDGSSFAAKLIEQLRPSGPPTRPSP